MKTTRLASLIPLVASLQLALAAPPGTADYTAHEWGTFTSIQGSDGQPIRWNPLAQSDLPTFVHTRNHPAQGPAVKAHAFELSLLDQKSSHEWYQRMETPVIYFHSDHPLTVDVHVGFPSGLITEWYPAASDFGPGIDIPGLLTATTNRFARWDQLEILAPDAAKSDALQPPKEAAPSHYYAARSARANPVRTTRGLGKSTDGTGESDQFLFYRGVANFTAPVRTRWDAAGIHLENTGREPLPTAFLWRAAGSRAELTRLHPLAPGATSHTRLTKAGLAGNRQELTRQFRDQLQGELTQAGLNADEAAAMVQTWSDSWFDEDGTRILYLVPRTFTDAVLPLQMNPAPRELTRVFVGRAELLDPSVEKAAWQEFADFRRSPQATVMQAFAQRVPARFAAALLNRAYLLEQDRLQAAYPGATTETHPEFKAAAFRLQQDVQQAQIALYRVTQTQAATPASTPPVAANQP
jgi:hypothetical protein